MIDAYASQPHYIAHIAPVLAALPDERRGHVYLGLNGNEIGPYCKAREIPWMRGAPPASLDPVLIAGGPDLARANGRPIVFVEHGAGQTYIGVDHAGYTGGRGRDQVQLFLSPNEQTAERNLARYPRTRAGVIGDPTIFPVDRLNYPPRERGPLIAVTFHFDLKGLCPETRWTWPYWANAILDLTASYDVLGHAHPRAQAQLTPWWLDHNVMCTDRFEDVMACADLLIVDNSSAGPEIARTGRPIIWLNAPHYRRDVHHGGRFWEWTEWAHTVDEPEQLPAAVVDVLANDPYAQARSAATQVLYPLIGDEAAQAAATAILDL